MPSPNQTDLFASATEPDLFGDDYSPPVYHPDPERVRRRLHRILSEARAAETMPWRPAIVSLYQTIFPQMSLALPEDEGAQLRLAFSVEIERLQQLPD